jgi:hypothetical protein
MYKSVERKFNIQIFLSFFLSPSSSLPHLLLSLIDPIDKNLHAQCSNKIIDKNLHAQSSNKIIDKNLHAQSSNKIR